MVLLFWGNESRWFMSNISSLLNDFKQLHQFFSVTYSIPEVLLEELVDDKTSLVGVV